MYYYCISQAASSLENVLLALAGELAAKSLWYPGSLSFSSAFLNQTGLQRAQVPGIPKELSLSPMALHQFNKQRCWVKCWSLERPWQVRGGCWWVEFSLSSCLQSHQCRQEADSGKWGEKLQKEPSSPWLREGTGVNESEWKRINAGREDDKWEGGRKCLFWRKLLSGDSGGEGMCLMQLGNWLWALRCYGNVCTVTEGLEIGLWEGP